MNMPHHNTHLIVPYDSAIAGDLAAVTAIYDDHVRHGTGSFEITPPDVAEMRSRFAALEASGHPIMLVKDRETGAVLGFGYAGPHKARAAYNHTVEDSVYLRSDVAGKGIGRALLARLIAESKARGFEQMMAVIGDSENLASINLHRSLGFVEVGVARNVGFKFGRYLDVVFMQLDMTAGKD
jgi:L-amino acid N-acyltransferase YncA